MQSLLNRAQPVFVVNAPSSGTAVDTYTKMELDAKFCEMGNRIATLAASIEEIRRTSYSDINKLWLLNQINAINEKISNLTGKLDSTASFAIALHEQMEAMDETLMASEKGPIEAEEPQQASQQAPQANVKSVDDQSNAD